MAIPYNAFIVSVSCRAAGVSMMQLAAGLAFPSYIDPVTGKQRRSCAEYVTAGLARAAELGATEELHRLSAVKELLSGCLKENKDERWVGELIGWCVLNRVGWSILSVGWMVQEE